MSTRKSPAPLGCGDRAIVSDWHLKHNPRSLAEQRLSQRFGLTPTLATVIATLAGLGPREARI